jgi:hypothetical protein
VIGSDVTGSDVSHETGSDANHMTGSDVSHVTRSDVITGSDVIFPRFFILTRVEVQNVPLLFIIPFTVSDYSFGIFGKGVLPEETSHERTSPEVT